MDRPTLEHELRQIKRRRIEIRGSQAALDLEDLNLDDRQKAIEQLLRSRPINVAPTFTRHTPTPFRQQGQPPQGITTTFQRPSQNHNGSKNVGAESIAVKRELNGRPREKSVVAIQDNLEGDFLDDDFTMLVRSNSLAPRFNGNTTKKRPSENTISRNAPSPELITRDDSQPRKPSKIVVLKVRYEDETYRQKTGNAQARKKPAPTKSPAHSRLLHSIRSGEFSVVNSKRLGRLRKQASPELQPHPAQIDLTQNMVTDETSSSVDLTCPCDCRKRNCNICRGTPAVIAEGRKLASLTSPSTSHNNTTRMLGQRPTSRPTSYQIPDYEEMSDTERQQLEIRFIHRIVTHLSKILQPDSNHDDASSAELSLRFSLWAERLRAREDVSKHLSESLQSLLKRRPVARETEDGIWDGRIMVPPVKDVDEFIQSAQELAARVTARHPLACCSLQKIEDVRDANGGDACWIEGFQSWLLMQRRKCRECIDACDAALDLQERKGLVDEWEIT